MRVGGEQRARLVHARVRRGALAADREADQAGEAARAHLFTRADRRPGAVGALRAVLGRGSTSRAASTGRRSRASSTSGTRRQRHLEAPAPRAQALKADVLRQSRPTPYGAGTGARLHAREGHGRRRRRLHGQLQPVALGRAERRERARDRRRRARGPPRQPSSTRCAPATRSSTRDRTSTGSDPVTLVMGSDPVKVMGSDPVRKWLADCPQRGRPALLPLDGRSAASTRCRARRGSPPGSR